MFDIFNEKLLKQPKPSPSKRFEPYEECSAEAQEAHKPVERYDKMIWLDDEAKQKWDEAPECVKRSTINILVEWLAEKEMEIYLENHSKIEDENRCKYGSAPI